MLECVCELQSSGVLWVLGVAGPIPNFCSTVVNNIGEPQNRKHKGQLQRLHNRSIACPRLIRQLLAEPESCRLTQFSRLNSLTNLNPAPQSFY